MDTSALKSAIKVMGGQTALAVAIGKTQGHVSKWLERGRVPGEHCRQIEQATKGAVTVHQLRPDIFGPAPARRKAA